MIRIYRFFRYKKRIKKFLKDNFYHFNFHFQWNYSPWNMQTVGNPVWKARWDIKRMKLDILDVDCDGCGSNKDIRGLDVWKILKKY